MEIKYETELAYITDCPNRETHFDEIIKVGDWACRNVCRFYKSRGKENETVTCNYGEPNGDTKPEKLESQPVANQS